MSQFIFSIVGIVFLGVLIDIIYPNGKTNGFCKSIFAIFSLIVIIKPISKIKNFDFETSNFVNSNFVYRVNEARIDSIKNKIESHLILNGIDGVVVEIDGIIDDNEIIIENVYIDITSLVLSENLTNINKYEVITDEVVKVVNIDKERIIIYE